MLFRSGLWMRGQNEAHGIVFDVRGHGHFAHELLQAHQRSAFEHLAQLRLVPFRRAVDHFRQFGGRGITHQELEEA